MTELDTHWAPDQRAEALLEIARTGNGNEGSAADFLCYLRERMHLAGITRVSEISWLSPAGIRVFQATRPLLHSHIFFGQNCGSQGKGLTEATAQIAAIMESIEAFSAEPRNPWLVRGSYDFLSRNNHIVAPDRFLASSDRSICGDECLMWTFAHSLKDQADVLVPAERVYFPFFPQDYATRSHFLSNSTGLAAGQTRARAVLHGFYEVLERHFRAGLEYGEPQLHVERLETHSLSQLEVFARIAQQHPEFTVCVLALYPIVGACVVAEVAMVACLLIDENGAFYPGYACRHDPEAAVTQAAVEALQCAVTVWSGSREDGTIRELALRQRVGQQAGAAHTLAINDLPSETLHHHDFCTGVADRSFIGPREELEFLREYAERLGYPEVFVKDLTVIGLEVPVVRVLIPGTAHPGSAMSAPNVHTRQDLLMCQYSFDL